MDTELIVAYVILASSLVALFLVIGFFAWRSKALLGRPEAPLLRWPWSLKWMVALTAGTGCLLAVQALLGIFTGALALMADSAHGAADFAMYTLASSVEYFKLRLGADAISAEAALQLDRASAVFSTGVMVAMSIFVCIEATHRLMASDQAVEHGLGSAMMLVAGLGMAMNLSLLALRSWMLQANLAHAPHALQSPDRDPAMCPPCVSCDSPRRGAIDTDADKRPSSGEGKVGEAADDKSMSLHAAFHPGCLSPGCAAGGAECNLNMYGVVLHVACDVARTFLMFGAGALVKTGVLASSEAVDAVCSYFIAACVLLGCVWLLRVACGSRSREQPTAPLSARAAAAPVAYGAAA